MDINKRQQDSIEWFKSEYPDFVEGMTDKEIAEFLYDLAESLLRSYCEQIGLINN